MGDSGVSFHITYNKKDRKDVEKCEINVTARNGQKMKYKLKGSVKMNIQGGETAKLNKLIYLTQDFKSLLSVLRLVSKGATMKDNQEKRPSIKMALV